MSHVDPKEVSKFMERLEGIYEDLMITRGKINNYHGMPLNLWTPVEIWVTMVNDLKGALEGFPEVVTVRSTSLVADCLSQVIPERERTLIE